MIYLFQKAIDVLSDEEMVNTGIRFAKLERKLGEIDRARAIYAHISQFSNPEGTTFNSQINKRIKKDDDYQLWKIWEEFEMKFGNVDTYKEFMRV